MKELDNYKVIVAYDWFAKEVVKWNYLGVWFQLVRTKDAFKYGNTDRSAMKVQFWNSALKLINGTKDVIFLDADTFPMCDISSIFDEKFDIGYTIRKGRWPLNSGVVFLRSNKSGREFMNLWQKNTDKILGDPEMKVKARATHGAVDQMAFDNTIEQSKNTKVASFACDIWNQGNCIKDIESVKIFHFKGCLPLLLGDREYGAKFGDERQPEICEPIFDLWRKYYEQHKLKT